MADKYDIKMIIDNNVVRATKICEKLNITPVITNKFDDYFDLTNIDIVVESASVNSVQNYAMDILKKSDLLIYSLYLNFLGIFFISFNFNDLAKHKSI